MRPVQAWLNEYGESHVHPTNKLIHWLCVPLIVIAIIGLLWSIPAPAAFARVAPWLNWGVLFIIAASVYYFVLSVPLALGMLLFSAATLALLSWADGLAVPLWQSSLAVFVIAWIGQFVGHIIEGEKPSFFKDLQFLMIGPIWLLGFVYKRLGIRY